MIRETESNRIRILYVEDDKDLRLPISQILTILSYEVICVDNGKQGIETAESWKPDIILMDLRMPVMDGPEAIRILRSKPDTWAIPIFVLTAYSDAKNRKLCKEAGIEKFFVKPIDVKEVDAAIKEILERQNQERTSRLRNPLAGNNLIHASS
jgi:CheY-like chemotaxis protein